MIKLYKFKSKAYVEADECWAICGCLWYRSDEPLINRIFNNLGSILVHYHT